MNRKIMLIPLTLAAAFSLVACGGESNDSSTSSSEESSSSSSSSQAAVVAITVDKTTVSIDVGDSELVTATVTGTDTKTVTWTSSDTTVATVTNGLITGVKEGTAKVTVTSTADTTKSKEISVTVKAKELKKLSSITGPVSTSDTYYGVVTAITSKGFFIDDGTGALYVYKTLPSGYALGDYVSVTDTINGYYGMPETTSSAKIAKADGTAPTPKAATALTIDVINTVQAQCTDATSSSSTTAFHLADIGPYSFTATAVKVGNYTSFYLEGDTSKQYQISPAHYKGDSFVVGADYTVTGYYGGKHTSGYYQFYVKSAEPSFKAVESISLDKTTATIDNAGEAITLTATVLPAGSNTKVTWESSDESVATVTNGTVTALKAGTTTIKATSVADTSKTATCTVTVSSSDPATYTSVVKYDFTGIPSVTGSSAGTINASSVTTYLSGNYVTSGENIVTGCTTATRVYQANSEQGPKKTGLKIGSSSDPGTLILTLSKEIKKVVLEGYAWSSTKLATVTVNDSSSSFEGTDLNTLSFTFGKSSQLKITTDKYCVFTSMEFFVVSAD